MSTQYPQHLGTARVVDQPTAWQSAPGPVRFAVWVWAVLVISGVVASAIGAVIWIVFLFVTLGAQ